LKKIFSKSFLPVRLIAITRLNKIVLPVCLLVLFACAPTKVKIYPREAQPEKTIPEKTSSERPSQEKTAPAKTILIKPPSEKTPTEKIPTVIPFLEKTYDETVSELKSYQDLAKWMENNYSVDIKRFEGTPPIPRIPSETFQLKSGIDIDAAMFLKETLNRINPSYQAKIVVVIIRPNVFNRYVCSFKKDDKLFIMNYGTPHKEVTGVYGPYNSLEEYKEFYEKHNPTKRTIEGIIYLR
jgi:hypothetical protein